MTFHVMGANKSGLFDGSIGGFSAASQRATRHHNVKAARLNERENKHPVVSSHLCHTLESTECLGGRPAGRVRLSQTKAEFGFLK